MFNTSNLYKKNTLKSIYDINFLKKKYIGYITNILAYSSIPHSKIKNFFFKRDNGYSSLKIIADPEYGLPYGIIPRIFMIWLCTQAKLKKSPQLYLGKNQNEFLKKLGFTPTGGINGTINRVRIQIIRILNSTISLTYNKDNTYKFKNLMIMDSGILFWSKKKSFWESRILLSKNFYKEIKNTSLPIDLRLIKNIRSPLAMDIYIWLTWRSRIINKSIFISWEKLKFQFGSNYSNNKKGLSNFKLEFIKKLKYIYFFYKNINFEISNLGLKLKNSNPHIPFIK